MEESLAFYISALKKNLTAYSDERLKRYGLTDGLFYYLIFIGKHPGCSFSEMARYLHADNGHVTRCVVKLEQLKYVERSRDEVDHRHYHLTLTPVGNEIFAELYTLLYDWEQIVCGDLSEKQKDGLFELLRLCLPHMKGDRHV